MLSGKQRKEEAEEQVKLAFEELRKRKRNEKLENREQKQSREGRPKGDCCCAGLSDSATARKHKKLNKRDISMCLCEVNQKSSGGRTEVSL